MGLRIGGITFSGISSGLPTDDIIEQLLELERRPIDLLEKQKAGFEQKLEILQDLNTKTNTLRDTLRKLDNMTLVGGVSIDQEFKRFAATASDSSVISATADSTAQAGSINVRVDALAAAQRDISTQQFTNLTDTVGTGNFRLSVAGVDTDISVDASNNSVNGFVAAINDSGADVTAFVLNDGSATPYRIMITANETGATQTIGYTIDPGISLSFVTTQPASDASIVIDPGANQIDVSSTTNTFADVIQGVTFDVRKVSATTQTIDVDEDQEAMTANIAELVGAYNDVIDVINEQAKVDPTTNRGGPLLGDSTLISLQRRLSTIVTGTIGSGSITAASQIGITIDRDGRMSLDEDKLAAQIAASLDDLTGFFAGAGSFSDQLRDVTDDFLDPVSGFLIARIDGVTDSIADLDDQVARAEERLEDFEANLVRQFTALESQISEIQLQANFLNQFILASLG